MTVWFALCCMLICWSVEMSADNCLNSNKLGIEINTSTLQPVVQHLMDTPSPAIVLTLDVSASMEYQVCISVVWRNHPMRELIKFRNLKKRDCATVVERCCILPPLPSPLFAPRFAGLRGHCWVVQQ
jgi:hypothetical protein